MTGDIMGGRIQENHEPKRAEDFSFLARVSSVFLKYNWIVSLMMISLYALGFGLETPSKKFDEVKAEIRTNKAAVDITLDSLRKVNEAAMRERAKMMDLLIGVALDVCTRRSQDTYAYQRLNCNKLLNGEEP